MGDDYKAIKHAQELLLTAVDLGAEWKAARDKWLASAVYMTHPPCPRCHSPAGYNHSCEHCTPDRLVP